MEKLVSIIREQRYTLSFLALGAVYLCNSLIDIMDIDAAQYAALAMEMVQTGNYLEIYLRGADYLDKPPLLFWLSSLSYRIFGFSNFAYKLPAILVLLLGMYSTFRFATMWYSRKSGYFAALILGSTMAYFLMTNDVRTDGILTGFVIFSVWQLSCFIRESNWRHLIWGAAGAACAMMAKGPLGLVIIAMALGGDLLLKRDWKSVFRWQWLVFIGMVGILLLPMCFGLYQQFDLHPEKIVYGLQGPSGIEFFFWTQSFGRITGDIYWSNDAGYFFFLHTILWDLQPWVLLFIPALILRVRALFAEGIRKDEEYITLSGFILAFAALSMSNYKLPHYIFPLFPFAAVIIADFILSIGSNAIWGRRMSVFQFVIGHLFFVAAVLSYVLFFTPGIIAPLITTAGYVIYWLVWLKTTDHAARTLFASLVAVTTFALVMSVYFYPNLLRYQSFSVAASEVRAEGRSDQLYYFDCGWRSFQHSLDFYSHRNVPKVDEGELRSLQQGSLILVAPDCSNPVLGESAMFELQTSYPHYRIATLSIDFLLHYSRDAATRDVRLYEKVN